MVKDHSDSERGNPLPPHGLLFPISSKGYFICIIPQTGWHIPQPLLHQSWTLAGTRNSSMGPPWRIIPMTHCVMSERSYHGAISLRSHHKTADWLSGLGSQGRRPVWCVVNLILYPHLTVRHINKTVWAISAI